jgi:D-aminoacyl-tRNA deacylase
MITVLQRVTSASVTVDGHTVGAIGHGLLALVAVTREDTPADVKWTADKLIALRLFRDPASDKHFELDVRQVGGSILLVSQFTLAADARKGRRPSFDAAAPPEQARQTFDELVRQVAATGIPVATGQFQADMQVTLTNDGPVTILLDSRSGSVARSGS